jgi:hypothetical protein
MKHFYVSILALGDVFGGIHRKCTNIFGQIRRYHEFYPSTVIPRFTSLIRSSKTARKAKTRKTRITFLLLPDGNNDRFARGRDSYKRKSARKLKKIGIYLCISYERKLLNRLLVYRGIAVFGLNGSEHSRAEKNHVNLETNCT